MIEEAGGGHVGYVGGSSKLMLFESLTVLRSGTQPRIQSILSFADRSVPSDYETISFPCSLGSLSSRRR